MNCQRCNAKTADTYLCHTHTTELADMYHDLPRLTAHLTEAATGQTRLGERSRRTRADDAPLKVNLRASNLLHNTAATLIRHVHQTCQTQHITYRPIRIRPTTWPHDLEAGEVRSETTGTFAELAYWLAANIGAVTAADTAGDRYNEIHSHIGRILHVLNRPTPPRFCGPCPGANPDDPSRRCEYALNAKRDALEVHCPQCENTWNIDDLLRRLLSEIDHWRFTSNEILMIMDTLGDPINERTFRRWRKANVVRPAGWRRPDGRVTLRAHGNDEPMYRLSDVRKAKIRPLEKGKA